MWEIALHILHTQPREEMSKSWLGLVEIRPWIHSGYSNSPDSPLQVSIAPFLEYHINYINLLFYNICRSRELSAVRPVLLDIRTPYARKNGGRVSLRVETAEE